MKTLLSIILLAACHSAPAPAAPSAPVAQAAPAPALITIEAKTKPSLADAAKQLKLNIAMFDQSFGVVMIKDGLYTVRVLDASKLPPNMPNVFSDPKIETGDQPAACPVCMNS
ncbi:MAG: hypothetical protein QM831_03445 [Kofleriaceae bacterium]